MEKTKVNFIHLLITITGTICGAYIGGIGLYALVEAIIDDKTFPLDFHFHIRVILYELFIYAIILFVLFAKYKKNKLSGKKRNISYIISAFLLTLLFCYYAHYPIKRIIYQKQEKSLAITITDNLSMMVKNENQVKSNIEKPYFKEVIDSLTYYFYKLDTFDSTTIKYYCECYNNYTKNAHRKGECLYFKKINTISPNGWTKYFNNNGQLIAKIEYINFKYPNSDSITTVDNSVIVFNTALDTIYDSSSFAKLNVRFYKRDTILVYCRLFDRKEKTSHYSFKLYNESNYKAKIIIRSNQPSVCFKVPLKMFLPDYEVNIDIFHFIDNPDNTFRYRILYKTLNLKTFANTGLVSGAF